MTPRKLAINAFLFIVVSLVAAIWQGTPFDPALLWIILILSPVFGAIIWLRWDWAPREGRRRRAERAARKDNG